ncbi:MAG TPA: hypothetical protein VFJ70_10775 [Burkholderiales bacterium]|nr:hypothetical protein [Burkholderiales bacterium]
MFIGHFAVAFAAKRALPTVSLASWFIASELIDFIWPILLLLGIESAVIAPGITAFTPLDFVHYPWSHSLLMCAVWAVAAAALYWTRSRVAAVLLGLVVLSHWFLDLIVHRPDLPLAPGTDMKLGFGLWSSIPGTLAVELALFAVGLGFYLHGTGARDTFGRYGLWTLVVLLLLAYGGAAFGPPPPNVATVAWADIIGGLLLVSLAYWVDAHRTMKG